MIPITFTNSLRKEKELFKPTSPGKVSLYVCGITPYDYPHIGHGRVYSNFDVIVRFLRFVGYEVTYVRNITDIEDKLLKRAEETTGNILDYQSIAAKFISFFHEDMRNLNCISPDVEPLATEHVDYVIKVVQGLLDNGHAYHLDNDVYFDITKSASYGILSGKKIDELQAGARVEINEKKRNAGDFVLWKGNKENLFWQSPWGYGRPGWHIECSAMSYAYLGETLDIHAGGADLMFPHHENEIAQSEGFTGKKFVNYWLHNAFVNVDNEKMSKSLGNSVTLRYLAQHYDPMVLRFYFLQHHYRTPLDFSLERLASALPAYKKLINLCEGVLPDKPLPYQDVVKQPLAYQMVQMLADDCNTPRMIGLIFEHIETIRTTDELKKAVASLLVHILGLRLTPLTEQSSLMTPEIEALLKQREQARADKDWQKADQLRDRLRDLGYTVQDKKLS